MIRRHPFTALAVVAVVLVVALVGLLVAIDRSEAASTSADGCAP